MASIVNPYTRKRPRPQEEQLRQETEDDSDSEELKNDTVAIQAQHSNDASALIISASDKAGMDGIDRQRIDEIILRESGDSKYMQQQRKRDEKVNKRIAQYKQRLQEANPSSYASTIELDRRIQDYQQEQATRSTCVVVDVSDIVLLVCWIKCANLLSTFLSFSLSQMDMFYMACELLTRPDLKDRPSCVGRGMILTSNYAARRYGVRSAMPGFIGDKLVEELSKGKEKLIHVRSNFDLYKAKSKQVVEVLREFDPNLKSYSLDEAYLDLGPYLVLYLQQQGWDHEQISKKLMNDATTNTNTESKTPPLETLQSFSTLTCGQAVEQVVHNMRQRVQRATDGLTCSAGIAPNFSLAKIASDKNKPNGQLLISPSNVIEFCHPLPVRKIPGIGRVTEKILNACQISTVKDLYDQRGLVNWLFQPATGTFLLRASVGCNGHGVSSSDFGNVEEDENSDHQKGISRERTFGAESDWTTLNSKLEDIARLLSKDMQRKSVMAHTITVKVKLDSFDVWSRSQSLKRGVYVQAPEEMVTMACQLFAHIRAQCKKRPFSCRLLGVRCSNLIEEEAFTHPPQKTIDKFLSSAKHLTKPAVQSSEIVASPYVVTSNKKPVNSPNLACKKLFPHQEPTEGNAVQTASKTPLEESSSKLLFEEVVECPLCNLKFPVGENDALNRHIDTCLNKTTVRQAVREASRDEPAGKKRRQLTDFW